MSLTKKRAATIAVPVDTLAGILRMLPKCYDAGCKCPERHTRIEVERLLFGKPRKRVSLAAVKSDKGARK